MVSTSEIQDTLWTTLRRHIVAARNMSSWYATCLCWSVLVCQRVQIFLRSAESNVKILQLGTGYNQKKGFCRKLGQSFNRTRMGTTQVQRVAADFVRPTATRNEFL